MATKKVSKPKKQPVVKKKAVKKKRREQKSRVSNELLLSRMDALLDICAKALATRVVEETTRHKVQLNGKKRSEDIDESILFHSA